MGLPISPDIYALKPYSPGKPVKELERELGIRQAIKLASNENPLGPSPRALAAVRQALDEVHQYPEGGGTLLREILARRFQLEPSSVVLGNGSNEIVELLVRAFLQPGEEAIMADPTFVVYQLIVRAAHGRPVSVPLRDGCHDLGRMADRISPRTRLIFLCNPNNPTGTIVRREEVAEFLEQIPDSVLLVCDEAYYEYVVEPAFPDCLEFLRAGRNVAVLRTFSKIYGLAGLRIGYGLTTREIADMLHRVRQPFNTNCLAQVAAEAALLDEDHLRKSREVNEAGKSLLSEAFTRMGLKYYPTQANFFYVDVGRDGQQIYAALLREGVIARFIEGHSIRVTIGLPEENEKFLQSLRKVLKK